jgi:glycoprotein endo-alpha-1,2-mannosidase
MRRIGLITLSILLATASAVPAAGSEPDPRVHTFYYGWYASEQHDGHCAHWNHDVLDDSGRAFPGGRDIGANYYPALGTYSSHDPAIVQAHMEQIRAAGIGVVVVSWWGPETFEDLGVSLLLDEAHDHGLKVAFHLEPFPGRDAPSSRGAIAYLLDTYGGHPAVYRPADLGGRPVLYVYDSYLTEAADWARLLQPDGEIAIRGTELDVVMIGLWVGPGEGGFFLTGGFDGYYTYFAADGFTWGSTAASWAELVRFGREHGLVTVPCVGPGYCDTRIRPWNAGTTRSREQGTYYDRMFTAAIAADPHWIGVTSFNEWHEGTQIEPSVPMTVGDFRYLDFTPREPDFYLERTRYWVERWPR